MPIVPGRAASVMSGISNLARWSGRSRPVHCGSDKAECGANLAKVYHEADPGDALVLDGGVYAGSGNAVLTIDKSVTLKAQVTSKVVLDGQGKRTVLSIKGGDVHVIGLNITGGNADDVSIAARTLVRCLQKLPGRHALMIGARISPRPISADDFHSRCVFAY